MYLKLLFNCKYLFISRKFIRIIKMLNKLQIKIKNQ